ncbi:MAG: selenium metabolism-associated LysR family transcriptional regulator [Caldimicrobium sp.]|nr:selenium metabolism-associated LysR family transcriptional regulator [Caldimicrobium sp.]MCX7613370.1 selenium metabolism-associated LysR family transcriptional regulator [Caldimicrobium sp.]MDW8182151.1 selenium metabolism-associated LysR family transcriptional regulator [Caldimicrobium sp.]
MFDQRKLEVFIKLFETKSFSKTAKALFLSQPTVTSHIKDLENHLGVKLFDRSTRSVLPSKASKIAYHYGRQILQLLKDMERDLIPYRDAKAGFIEIGGSTIPGQYILPPIVKEFREKYPEITIYLKVGDTREIIEQVLAGDIEFGVVGAKIKENLLNFEACCEDEITLIGPGKNSPGEIELETLYDLPLIKREDGSGTWKTVIDHLESIGLEVSRFKIVGEMGSTEAVKRAVMAGLGFSFVSRRAIELEVSTQILKRIEIKNLSIKRNFFLVYRKQKTFTPACETFLTFYRAALS